MRMVVEIDGNVDTRDPAKHDDRSRDECGHRPEAVNMGTLRMKVYPKRAAVSQQRHSVEDETVRVGLVAQDPFSAHRRLSSRNLLVGQSACVSVLANTRGGWQQRICVG